MRHPKRIAGALFAAAALVSGCSGPGGILGTERYPQGNVTVSSYPGGKLLTTSPANPYMVAGTFSVSIAETDFSGPYAITMYSWSNGFNEPCFVPHETSATIYTFSPDHANPASDPKTTPNPCKAGDIETALINDGDGHDVYFSFELTAALTGGAVPTPTPTSGNGGVACSQGDPNSGSIELTGSFQQFDFPKCNDYTILATLPANSGSGDAFSYAISGDSTFGAPTTASDGTPMFALSFEPSPNSFTLSDTTQSLTISANSPSKFGGGTFTVELLADGTEVQTIKGLSPQNDTLSFNLQPTGAEFDPEPYTAIVYRGGSGGF